MALEMAEMGERLMVGMTALEKSEVRQMAEITGMLLFLELGVVSSSWCMEHSCG